LLIALTACFGAGSWVILATLYKLPVSTSHAIVGAVGGSGLAIGAPIFWDKIGNIFVCWLFTPVGAAILAYIFYYPIRLLYYRLTPALWRSRVLRWLIILTSAYSAFSWGGNDVANATGVLLGANMTSMSMAALIGGGAILLGIVTLGYKVIETVGYRITRLLPIMAVVAQVASAFNVYIYTILGIPVSTSHSIVGAVMGVGLATKKYLFDVKLAGDIVFAWAITPFAAGALSFLLTAVAKWWFVI
jgi:PiT family inorganic phosphate transporter